MTRELRNAKFMKIVSLARLRFCSGRKGTFMQKIRKGDDVIVIAGRDKGRDPSLELMELIVL